ncbi:hypothetical protein GCM10027280_41760 [Micromonospora polyrhachis]|uniref:PPE family protein n=1 Tax=Micromonospora polyrhachis TaxID=1282883 RepID=A0A7W7SLR3_9ACTN|nr:hypothetical protein [Micromonospora polyrhachis]MBB4957127.1 hypothetical protein [Micromonospora polyrhachis]
MGDSDLLEVESAGLRTFADAVAGAGTAYAGDARARLDAATAVATQLGQPAGFAEMQWFAELAGTDLTALRAFSDDLVDGMASTARGAELASQWYEGIEDSSARQLRRIQESLRDGDIAGPSYGDGTTAQVTGSTTGRRRYPYARPGPQRTDWAGLDADQIFALVIGARPERAEKLATDWRAAGASIGLAGDLLAARAKTLHWYGEGGREFRRSVTRTVDSTERWQANTRSRAVGYEAAAKALSTAQDDLRAVIRRRDTALEGMRIDLAVAISPLGQAGVQKQIKGVEDTADREAREIAVRLSGELVEALREWQPATPYQGLLGLATAGGGPTAADEPGGVRPLTEAGLDEPPGTAPPGLGPTAPPGIGPSPGPGGVPPGLGGGPTGPGVGPLGAFRPAALPSGTPGTGIVPLTPRPVTALPPAVLPTAPGPGGLLGPGGVLGPVPPGRGLAGGYALSGSGQGVPALGRMPDRDPPVRQLAAPEGTDTREPTLGSRKDLAAAARENDGVMPPMVPGLYGRGQSDPPASRTTSARRGTKSQAAPTHLSGREAPTRVGASDEPDRRSPIRAPRTPRRGELGTGTHTAPATAGRSRTEAETPAQRNAGTVPTMSEGEAYGR